MVRHGEAAAGYSEHPDPGLSDRGRQQAEAVADELAAFGSLEVVSSPMGRAQETAAPFAARRSIRVAIEPAVSEIPSPAGLSPAERGGWLQTVMAGTWAETSDEVRSWRDQIAATLVALDIDTVVFSHFVAINAAIAVAIGADTPRCRHVDHCSITTFETTGGELALISEGRQGRTKVL
ncbi:MAG: histidine phosphatase family protein, partial [Acidimicrobiales bacterium]